MSQAQDAVESSENPNREVQAFCDAVDSGDEEAIQKTLSGINATNVNLKNDKGITWEYN